LDLKSKVTLTVLLYKNGGLDSEFTKEITLSQLENELITLKALVEKTQIKYRVMLNWMQISLMDH
jgi:hypothetical protein